MLIWHTIVQECILLSIFLLRWEAMTFDFPAHCLFEFPFLVVAKQSPPWHGNSYMTWGKIQMSSRTGVSILSLAVSNPLCPFHLKNRHRWLSKLLYEPEHNAITCTCVIYALLENNWPSKTNMQLLHSVQPFHCWDVIFYHGLCHSEHQMHSNQVYEYHIAVIFPASQTDIVKVVLQCPLLTKCWRGYFLCDQTLYCLTSVLAL